MCGCLRTSLVEGLGPNIIRKKSFEKYFLKWSFFLGDCDQAFEKGAYVPLSYKIKSRRNSKKKSFEKWSFEKSFFEMKFFLFFWVIMTRPLKRLPMYLSHRGSGPNIVQKKKKNWNFFWKMNFLKWVSFFLKKKKNQFT